MWRRVRQLGSRWIWLWNVTLACLPGGHHSEAAGQGYFTYGNAKEWRNASVLPHLGSCSQNKRKHWNLILVRCHQERLKRWSSLAHHISAVTVCHSMFALHAADNSIRALWNHMHPTYRSICFPWWEWFFPHPQTWTSLSVLLFWHLVTMKLHSTERGRRSRRGATLSRAALHCSHTLTPPLQKCTTCRAQESLSKMKVKQDHIEASVPCMPHLTSVSLNSNAQELTMTTMQIAIGLRSKSDKACKDAEERRDCLASFLQKRACPFLWSNNNKSETFAMMNSRLWHPSDPKHVLTISCWLPAPQLMSSANTSQRARATNKLLFQMRVFLPSGVGVKEFHLNRLAHISTLISQLSYLCRNVVAAPDTPHAS